MVNAHIQPSAQPILIMPSLGGRAIPGPDGQALTVIRWGDNAFLSRPR